jgi:hypothetical protein
VQSQEEIVVPSDESSPSGEAVQSQEEIVVPSDESSPSEDASASQSEEATASEAESTPSDEPPAEAETDPEVDQNPEEQVKAGTSDPDHRSTDAAQRDSGGSVSAMPDTAMTISGTDTGIGGLLAAIGVLLIVVAHAGTRRERTLPTA